MDADYEESGLISDDEDLEGSAPTFSPHSRPPPAGRQLRFPRAPETAGNPAVSQSLDDHG